MKHAQARCLNIIPNLHLKTPLLKRMIIIFAEYILKMPPKSLCAKYPKKHYHYDISSSLHSLPGSSTFPILSLLPTCCSVQTGRRTFTCLIRSSAVSCSGTIRGLALADDFRGIEGGMSSNDETLPRLGCLGGGVNG